MPKDKLFSEREITLIHMLLDRLNLHTMPDGEPHALESLMPDGELTPAIAHALFKPRLDEFTTAQQSELSVIVEKLLTSPGLDIHRYVYTQTSHMALWIAPDREFFEVLRNGLFSPSAESE